MIGGQYLDITGADDDLDELHRLKTGRLFAASVGLGLWVAGRAGGRAGALAGVRRGARARCSRSSTTSSTATATRQRLGVDGGARSRRRTAAERAHAALDAIPADTSVLRAIVDEPRRAHRLSRGCRATCRLRESSALAGRAGRTAARHRSFARQRRGSATVNQHKVVAGDVAGGGWRCRRRKLDRRIVLDRPASAARAVEERCGVAAARVGDQRLAAAATAASSRPRSGTALRSS